MSSESTAERAPHPAGAWTAALIVVAVSLLSTFTLADPSRTATDSTEGAAPGFFFVDPEGQVVEPDEGDGGIAEGPGTRRVLVDEGEEGVEGVAAGPGGQAGPLEGGPGGPGGPGGAGGPGAAAAGTYDCAAGQNAGATAPGVAAGEIRLGATVVRTGIARDFLSDARFGVDAVIQRVNAEGGICGRRLVVDYEDDGWETATGTRIIRRWINEGDHFGLIVNPSSEGLRGAIRGGLIRENGFPVVGADGMLIGQYLEDWVWPVATSTHSVMQIMATDAFERGARRFAIVWEGNFRFGVEGEHAFKKTVGRRCKGVSGCSIVANVEIEGGQSSYRNQADAFVGACGGRDFRGCDFVALLLEPATASQWVRDGGLGDPEARSKWYRDNNKTFYGLGAPQPLFVRSFMNDCGAPCNRMWVWTSFKPPIPPFDQEPAVREYVADLRLASDRADASNPHVQGAYVGARLFVEALKALPDGGAAPTRAGLQEVLDNMVYDAAGLAPPLDFRGGEKFAAVNAQAFEAVFNVGEFVGFNHVKGFQRDREVHVDQLRES